MQIIVLQPCIHQLSSNIILYFSHLLLFSLSFTCYLLIYWSFPLQHLCNSLSSHFAAVLLYLFSMLQFLVCLCIYLHWTGKENVILPIHSLPLVWLKKKKYRKYCFICFLPLDWFKKHFFTDYHSCTRCNVSPPHTLISHLFGFHLSGVILSGLFCQRHKANGRERRGKWVKSYITLRLMWVL